ncbi:MAG: hypothetical protein ACW99Q_09990 [Candidatus Kariarchaeaceae archaeon]
MIEQFLNDDFIDLLADSGVRSVADLRDYQGDDRFVLQIQYFMKMRLDKIKINFAEIEEKKLSTIRIGNIDQDIPIRGENYLDEVTKSRKKFSSLNIEGMKDTISKISSETLDIIEDYCNDIINSSENISNQVILENILQLIIPEIIGRELEILENNVSSVFKEAAQLSGNSVAAKFFENNDDSVGDYLKFIITISYDFKYDQLFAGLLERKISRLQNKSK